MRVLLYGFDVDGCNLDGRLLEDAPTIQIEKRFSPMGSFPFPFKRRRRAAASFSVGYYPASHESLDNRYSRDSSLLIFLDSDNGTAVLLRGKEQEKRKL